MVELINGKELVERMQAEITKKIQELKDNSIYSGLVVLLIEENPVSQIYVRNKERVIREIGVRSLAEHCPEAIPEDELLAEIEKHSRDSSFRDILVQLPLLGHIDEEKVLLAIRPEKGVDDFHPMNLGRLLMSKPGRIPCTPYSITEMFEVYSIDLAGKRAVVIGRSNIVGKPTAWLPLIADVTVIVTHSRTGNLTKLAQKADTLVVAVGHRRFVIREFVKPDTVVIDVGMDRGVNGKLVDDVKFDGVESIADWTTPVPRDAGPTTITMPTYQTVGPTETFGAGE